MVVSCPALGCVTDCIATLSPLARKRKAEAASGVTADSTNDENPEAKIAR